MLHQQDRGENPVLTSAKVRKVFETPSNYFDIEIGKKMIISEN